MEQWDGEIIDKYDGLIMHILGFLLSLFTLGLMAPLFFRDRLLKKSNKKQTLVSYNSFFLHNSYLFLFQNYDNDHMKNKDTQTYVLPFFFVCNEQGREQFAL